MRSLITLLIFLLCSSNLYADFTWDPASSTFGATSFIAVSPGVGRTPDASAFGAGFNSDGVFTFGFTNQVVTGLPTASQTELSSTALPAGTQLFLQFNKTAADDINFVGVLGNCDVQLDIQEHETLFIVQATIVDPVESASGDVGAAFGLVVNFQDNADIDYQATLFGTNMHYLDLAAPAGDLLSGTAAINGDGVDGVSATFCAFIPQHFLDDLGVSDTDDMQCFIDGVQVDADDFQNLGLMTGGFIYNEPSNPNDQFVKLVGTNDDWSAHDVQFGTITDTSAPNLKVKGGKKKTTSRKKIKIKGTVTDDIAVANVKFSKKGKKKEANFKEAKLNGNKWTAVVKGLKSGKRKKVFIKATDGVGNVSKIKKVVVTRE